MEDRSTKASSSSSCSVVVVEVGVGGGGDVCVNVVEGVLGVVASLTRGTKEGSLLQVRISFHDDYIQVEWGP